MSRLFRISVMLAVFYGIEKLLGFLRQILIARQFQLSAELDAFNAANNLPDLLFALISAGAIGMAFIPVLSGALQKDGRTGLWELFSSLARLTFRSPRDVYTKSVIPNPGHCGAWSTVVTRRLLPW